MPETPVSQDAVYSSIPTIQVDVQANDSVTSQLVSMEMREQEAGMSALELRFNNFGTESNGTGNFTFEDGQVLKLGAALVVYAGVVSSPTEIFRGKITAIEARFPRGGPAAAGRAVRGRSAGRAHEALHQKLECDHGQ